MVAEQHLDIRTITLGMNLRACTDADVNTVALKVYDRMTHVAENLVPTVEQLEREFGIPIVNKRIAVTPIAEVCAAVTADDLSPIAQAMDRAAKAVGVDFVGGFSALVHKGASAADTKLMESIPQALATTDFVCASVNVGSTRAGELMALEASKRLGVAKGILDLSLAPTPAEGDSVAEILEAIGVGTCGGPGTTAALALLNDAVKKGGVMASSSVGGLSGAFIPVSEDAGMIRAAESRALCLEKLEAMTSVCSVGLDMIAIPGDTSQETIFGIIADECAIGMINNKTTAVRLIPAIGKKVGDRLEFGGLLGYAPVMPVNTCAGTVFARRGGRMPAPLNSLKN